MVAPVKKRVRAKRRTSFLPKTWEIDVNIGWNTVDAKRKLVARLNVAVVLLLRDWAITLYKSMSYLLREKWEAWLTGRTTAMEVASSDSVRTTIHIAAKAA